ARLQVSRFGETMTCPDDETLAREIRERLTSRNPPGTLPPLWIQADVTREGAAFVATVRVSGRKLGVRNLRAEGSTCDALHEALLVALLVLLDEDPTTLPPFV